MVRNTSADLNNHLFEQLERLNDDEINGEDLKEEIGRSKAMADISRMIIDNAKLSLDAKKIKAQFTGKVELDSEFLAIESDES
ncbi:hypothetical protein [Jeotgalibaca porci]|uniref:hypothetical protein n=1 Tax=Jeotgalibaca porci TaxID=1868793 RepID=UPI0035A0ED2C